MQRILLHLSKVILLAATLFMMSCGNTQISEQLNNSKATTEVLEVTADFDKIRVSQNIEVELTQGPVKSFDIIASDEARKNLEIEVENGEVSIGFLKNSMFRNSSKVKIIITNPNISSLSTSSSAKIIGMNTIKSKNLTLKSSSGSEMELSVDTDEVEITCGSGSSIEIKGNSKIVTANSSSGSSIEAQNLAAASAIAKSSSGSSIELGLIQSLDAISSSGSSIEYKGSPQIIQQKATSGSSISSN